MKEDIKDEKTMFRDKNKFCMILLIVISFSISIFFYPYLAEPFASHWNWRGEADSYLPKSLGLFLIPFLLIGLTILFFLTLKIDPMRKNIELFRKDFTLIFTLLFCFLIGIQTWMILWNLGFKINPNRIFPLGIGVLFFVLGGLLKNVKRNWFIGIRTPWTLSNKRVWDETHKLGSKVFKIAGITTLFGSLFERYAMQFILIPVILSFLILFIYSYHQYKRYERTEKSKRE